MCSLGLLGSVESVLWPYTRRVILQTPRKCTQFLKKLMPLKCYHGRTGRGCDIILSAAGVVVNNQIKGKILATRRNMQMPIKQSPKSRNSFLRWVKAKQSEQSGKLKRKAQGFNSLLRPRGVHSVRTDRHPAGAHSLGIHGLMDKNKWRI